MQVKSHRLISLQLVEESRARIANSELSKTARRVAKALATGGFSYSIAGGYAVQEYGYVRHTHDVDLIVRERGRVRQYLASTGLFRPVSVDSMSVIDRENGVWVDLLPAGSRDTATAIPYPDPGSDAGPALKFVTLPELISLKLSAGRLKDTGDVGELIKVNELQADFADELPAELRARYRGVWEQAQAELATSREIADRDAKEARE